MLLQQEINGNNHHITFEVDSNQHDLSEFKGLKSYSQNIDLKNNINDQLSIDFSSNFTTNIDHTVTTTTLTTTTYSEQCLTYDKSTSKQLDYYTWENPPEVDAYGMKCDIVKKTHHQYGVENTTVYSISPRGSISHRRSSQSSIRNTENMKNISQKLNEDKISGIQHTMERIPGVRKTDKDYSPPRILLDNLPPESSQSIQKVANARDNQKNSSPILADKEYQSSSPTDKGSKINIPLTNRQQIPSKRLLSADRRAEGRNNNNGPFTIQFIMSSPESVQKGWINDNILISFMNTMEWICSRLTNVIKKNEVAYNYEKLQFVRYCQPQYITYSSLSDVKSLKSLQGVSQSLLKMRFCKNTDEHEADDDNKCANIDVTTDKQVSVGKRTVDNKINLMFKVGFQRIKEVRIPAMKLYQITSATSVPSSTSVQFYKSILMEKFERGIMDNITVLTTANLSLIKQMETISTNIASLIEDKSQMTQKTAATLRLCLEKLAAVLQSQKKSNKYNQNTKMEQSYSWFSYSADGTLTVRYPCGSPAIIWSSSPLVYHRSCSNINSCDPSSLIKGKGVKVKKSKEKASTTPTLLQRANTNVTIPKSSSSTAYSLENLNVTSKSEDVKRRTGFYLTIFDRPSVSLSKESATNLNRHDDKFNSQPTASLSTDHEMLTISEKENHLNIDLLHRSKNTTRMTNSVREYISSSCSMNSGTNQSDLHTEHSKSDESLQNEDVHIRKFIIGPLIAHFTPSGEGVIYYPNNTHKNNTLKKVTMITPTVTTTLKNDDGMKRLPTNIHAIFTKDYCYIFNNSSGDLQYQFPRSSVKSRHDPTIRFPVSLDINFNQYIKLIYTNCTDLTVIFKTEKGVLLNIDCFENFYTSDYNDMLSTTEDESNQCQQQYALSKLPFLSSTVDITSQNKQLITSRKRKEENLQKIFKNIPPITDLQSLSKHLIESKKRISFLCDQWLEVLRLNLGLQRYRIPSPRSTREFLRYKSIDDITKRFQRMPSISTSIQVTDHNKLISSGICNTQAVNNRLNTRMKSIKAKEFSSEQSHFSETPDRENLDTIHRHEIVKELTIEKDDQPSEEMGTVDVTIMRSLITGNNHKYA
ncbi:unnamed protein product [Heterobilharzia americana]|nr:unnamed protein product [Heterobilharzia americana]